MQFSRFAQSQNIMHHFKNGPGSNRKQRVTTSTEKPKESWQASAPMCLKMRVTFVREKRCREHLFAEVPIS
jgi:hypothetical protein